MGSPASSSIVKLDWEAKLCVTNFACEKKHSVSVALPQVFVQKQCSQTRANRIVNSRMSACHSKSTECL